MSARKLKCHQNQSWTQHFCFFFRPMEKIVAMTYPAHGVLSVSGRDSVRILLSKNPARSFNCPWCQVYGTSFERFPRPWQNEEKILTEEQAISVIKLYCQQNQSCMQHFSCNNNNIVQKSNMILRVSCP